MSLHPGRRIDLPRFARGDGLDSPAQELVFIPFGKARDWLGAPARRGRAEHSLCAADQGVAA